MARFAPLLVVSCLMLPAQARAESNQEFAGVLSICRGGTEAALANAQRSRGDAEVRAASVLPNPSFVLEHQRTLSGSVDRETVVGLSVPLGLSGHRGLLQEAADARRKQAFAQARAGLFEAALEFREAYARAALESARARVLTQNQAVLDSLTTLIQKLERAGEAAGYDQLRQEALARVHRQQLRLATAKAVSAQLLLGAWLGRDVGVNDADLVAFSDNVVPHSVAAPLLEVLEAEAQASEFEARAARRRAVPDVSIFGGYRALTAGAETGHGISLNLEKASAFTLRTRGR